MPTVLVCTVPALQRIHIADASAYSRLAERVSLVLVDEGHREPAPDWARAVRGLRKPTALLTATPYRNDHKVFNVDPGHVSAFGHDEAVREAYIREVEFHEAEFGSSPDAFVEELLRFYYGHFQTNAPSTPDSPKVIVRCGEHGDVVDIASRLRDAGQRVVAIHERFEPPDEIFRPTVPWPEMTDAVFWVHQNKLIEGIDDPSFRASGDLQPVGQCESIGAAGGPHS
jgi:hypothetical protein